MRYCLFMLVFILHVCAQLEGTLDDTLAFAKRYQTFRKLYFKQNEKEFVRLVNEGQSPKILFIGCSDSRVVPDLILNTRPGDLFVIRTAGNFVPTFAASSWGDGVSATLQFAIEGLGVKHIIVCGHSHCGAIQGLFNNLDNNKFGILKKWLRFGEEAKQMTLDTVKPSTPAEEVYQIAEEISVIFQLEHLLSFPFIKQKVDAGELVLHGWYYKIETGEVLFYDPIAYQFKSLSSVIESHSISR